ALRAQAFEAVAQDEMRGDVRTHRRRVHRSAGRTRGPWRAPRRLCRRRRLRLRGKSRHRLRHQAAAGPSRAAERDRNPEVAVQESHRPASTPGALGETGNRRPRGVHRVDRKPEAAPLATARSERLITHPEKVMFPAAGDEPAITKGELAAYYEAIAPVMLP